MRTELIVREAHAPRPPSFAVATLFELRLLQLLDAFLALERGNPTREQCLLVAQWLSIALTKDCIIPTSERRQARDRLRNAFIIAASQIIGDDSQAIARLHERMEAMPIEPADDVDRLLLYARRFRGFPSTRKQIQNILKDDVARRLSETLSPLDFP